MTAICTKSFALCSGGREYINTTYSLSTLVGLNMLQFTISLLNLFISVQIRILSGREFHSFSYSYQKKFNPLVLVLGLGSAKENVAVLEVISIYHHYVLNYPLSSKNLHGADILKRKRFLEYHIKSSPISVAEPNILNHPLNKCINW